MTSCFFQKKPNNLKMTKFTSKNKLNNYVSSKNNIKKNYEEYKDYFLCKYRENLVSYTIKYKKNDLLKWALYNDFNYSYDDCATTIDENLPKALEEILKKNQEKKLLEKKLAHQQGLEYNQMINSNKQEILDIIKKTLLNRIRTFGNSPNTKSKKQLTKDDKDILKKIVEEYLV